MSTFYYKARNLVGQTIEGTSEALDRFALAESLRKNGFVLFAYRLAAARKFGNIIARSFGRVTRAERAALSRNLSVMISAGLSLTRALEVLGKQTHNAHLRRVLAALQETVRRGKALSSGMESYPRVFSPFFRSMVAAGEESGTLGESLRLISVQLEREQALQRDLVSALLYPAIVLAALAGVGVLLLAYVIPSLSATFAELGAELPPTTRFVLLLGNGFASHRALVLAVLGVIVAAGVFFLRCRRTRILIDRAMLRLPIIGTVARNANAARAARTLSTLLTAGIPIMRALEITAGVVQNHVLKQVLMDAVRRIQRGEALSAAFLEDANDYPVLLAEMIAVGEETGKLTEVLMQTARFFEESVAATTKNLAQALEPALMIVVGVIIGFFAVSMIQPLYNIPSGL